MTDKNGYQALYGNEIFFGGAADVEDMVKHEGVEVIVDLRGEATECAYPNADVEWIQIPLGDNATGNQDDLFKQAIDEVIRNYQSGKKVGFHCVGGKGRTGTVAAGILLELGEADTVADAEAKAKQIRDVIDLNRLKRSL